MSKFISIGDSRELIAVKDAYPFTHDFGKGKSVLRVSFYAKDHSIEQIENMFDGYPVINCYEEREVSSTVDETSPSSTNKEITLISTYEDYTKDLIWSYNDEDDAYEIEITKKTETELAIEANQNQTIEGCEAIVELYESYLA